MAKTIAQPTPEEMKAQATALIEANEKAAIEKAAELDKTPLPNLEDEVVMPAPVVKEKPVREVEPPKPVAEKDWKVEHDKMFGTMSNTIAGLRKELDGVKGQVFDVETLRKENAELKAKATAPVKPEANDDEDLKAFRAEYGDELTDVQVRIMRSEAKKVASEMLKGIGADVASVKANVQKSAQEKYVDNLRIGYADAPEVIGDPAFHAFLKDELMYDAVYRENQAGNAPEVLKAIKKYKDSLTPPPPAETDEEKAEREEKEQTIREQAAGPGQGKGPKPAAPQTEPILTGLARQKFIEAYLNRDTAYFTDGKPKPKAKAMFDRIRIEAGGGE